MAGELFLLALAAMVLIALLAWIIDHTRVTPAERERRRRIQVNNGGRMADGVLTDTDGRMVYYSYSVRGVDYRTSQDLSELGEVINWDRDSIIGPVTLKYSPNNPANSIVACEEWSGLRARDSLLNDEEAATW